METKIEHPTPPPPLPQLKNQNQVPCLTEKPKLNQNQFLKKFRNQNQNLLLNPRNCQTLVTTYKTFWKMECSHDTISREKKMNLQFLWHVTPSVIGINGIKFTSFPTCACLYLKNVHQIYTIIRSKNWYHKWNYMKLIHDYAIFILIYKAKQNIKWLLMCNHITS